MTAGVGGPVWTPSLASRLATLAFPLRCPGCGRGGPPVCPACLAGARPAAPSSPPPGIAAWSAAFAYDGVVREWIARAKYHGAHAVLRPLAGAAARAWTTDGCPVVAVTCVTWVPTAPARRRARGFDHARVVAGEVARALGVPVVGLLERVPGAPADPQTGRPVTLRRRGPAVRLRRRWVDGGIGGLGPVLLVDDVTTTGASLRVGAAALTAAGARAVGACTIARTPPGRAAGPGAP